jgi:PAS domain S-box-containing protein
VSQVADLLKKMPFSAKLILIGLVPTVFFLYISFQYYIAEKQRLELLHNNIRIINRAAAVNSLIDQMRIERRYGYEFALKKDQYSNFMNQWKHTDSAINKLENVDPELKGITKYTLLDGLAGIRKNNTLKKLSPDAIMGYYTTTIFRVSYLDVTPELLTGNAESVNREIHGLKALSEMNIYLSIINSNIYNVLYTHSKYAVGTLYGLVGLYQVYNTFEKEFMMKGSPASIAAYRAAKQNSALKPVINYLDASFKRMNIDSTYSDVEWWKVSGQATHELKMLQTKLTAQVNSTLVNLEASERAKANRLLVLLFVALALITFTIVYTIKVIRFRLTELRIATEKIAAGETNLNLNVYSHDVIGKLAEAMARMDANNKMLAEAAIAIGSGDFDVPVKPRGHTDLLGNAILRMKDELQHFTAEKVAHAAELERLLNVIKQSETHFRQIADQTPFMIWQVDNKGEAIYVNQQWLDYTGISFKDSMGKGWMKALHPDELIDRPFSKAFADRVPYRAKARFKNANNEYRWMYIQGNPIFNGGFDGFIGSLTDITDQVAAEQAARELMYKKDEFLSIASHELRTPLTSIKAYTQLLHRHADHTDKSYQFITKTLDHVARLEKLINDLLDVSRINSGNIDYNLELFQFEELLKYSVDSFRDVSDKHKVIIQNTVTGLLKADRARIEQVFSNLLHNAAKYSPEANTILVNSFIDDGYVVVSVQDFGVGIVQEDRGQLFERFYRSEKTSNRFQGLGLGLFISAEIIKRHDGGIWVDSEPGNGSTFHFKLPLYQLEKLVSNELKQTG